MASKTPGKAHRDGITLVEFVDMFPDEKAATEWFESIIWPNGHHCPKCGSKRTREASDKKVPCWCTGCQSYFSVKTGTAMQASKIPLRKWAIAIYLCLTNLKSVSSMKLHRDIDVTQQTAWFMLHRIREAWGEDDDDQLDGPVEADETYVGGKRKNMSNVKQKAMKGAGPAAGKTAVIGVNDRESGEVRAEVITNTDGETFRGFVREHVEPGVELYTDEARAYKRMPEFEHEAVNHSVREYVDGMAHTAWRASGRC